MQLPALDLTISSETRLACQDYEPSIYGSAEAHRLQFTGNSEAQDLTSNSGQALTPVRLDRPSPSPPRPSTGQAAIRGIGNLNGRSSPGQAEVRRRPIHEPPGWQSAAPGMPGHQPERAAANHMQDSQPELARPGPGTGPGGTARARRRWARPTSELCRV